MALSNLESKQLRDLIIQEIDKECGTQQEVCIGLSSGIDSHVVLFGLLELGKKVKVFSFRREDIMSKDFVSAKNTATVFGLKFKEVLIPKYVLHSRIKSIIKNFDLKKKTDIEVLYTMSFVFDEMTGICFFGYPDHHFGLSQKAMRYYRKTLELNQKWREINSSEKGMRQASKWKELGAARTNALQIKLPLGNKALVDFFHPFTWDQLNKPKLKQPLLDAFGDYFQKTKVRSPQPLQCGDSGIREIFPQLLDTDLNSSGTRNMVKLYRDIWKSEQNKLGDFICD